MPSFMEKILWLRHPILIGGVIIYGILKLAGED